MSDIFDHALDAAESEMDYWNGSDSRPIEGFVHNPLYHHMKVNIHEQKVETDKAYLMFIEIYDIKVETWVPKALVKRYDKDAGTAYILKKFLVRKYKEAQ